MIFPDWEISDVGLSTQTPFYFLHHRLSSYSLDSIAIQAPFPFSPYARCVRARHALVTLNLVHIAASRVLNRPLPVLQMHTSTRVVSANQ